MLREDAEIGYRYTWSDSGSSSDYSMEDYEADSIYLVKETISFLAILIGGLAGIWILWKKGRNGLSTTLSILVLVVNILLLLRSLLVAVSY